MLRQSCDLLHKFASGFTCRPLWNLATEWFWWRNGWTWCVFSSQNDLHTCASTRGTDELRQTANKRRMLCLEWRNSKKQKKEGKKDKKKQKKKQTKKTTRSGSERAACGSARPHREGVISTRGGGGSQSTWSGDHSIDAGMEAVLLRPKALTPSNAMDKKN